MTFTVQIAIFLNILNMYFSNMCLNEIFPSIKIKHFTTMSQKYTRKLRESMRIISYSLFA